MWDIPTLIFSAINQLIEEFGRSTIFLAHNKLITEEQAFIIKEKQEQSISQKAIKLKIKKMNPIQFHKI